MQEPLLQSPWQKAKMLAPQVSSEVEIFRRDFRGERWYVLRRVGGDRLYRVNDVAWQIIGLCDGERTLEAIFNQVKTYSNDLQESDLLAIIHQLQQRGFLQLGKDNAPGWSAVPKTAAGGWLQKLKNPLAIRVPLWDPDKFLRANVQHVTPVFSRGVLTLWCLTVMFALLVALAHWQAISSDVLDRIISPQNLLLLWLIYPVTKVIHELGHAFAIKVFGGEVREIGVVFMYGIPLPYVDASAALTFQYRYQRLIVDGIGIMLELFMAALALFIWLNVSSGLVSQLAFNAMLICGVSTLFFNGNPLMRFDGYYLLADYLEIPNLATRSMQYWQHVLNRWLLAIDKPFTCGNRERGWLFVYAPLALVYRLFVLFAITLLAAQFYLPLGVALGVWILATQVIKPLVKGILYLLAPRIPEQRRRALRFAIGFPLLLILVLVVIPFPVQRTLPAVVWLPDQAKVRAGTEGVVEAVLVEQGKRVVPGEVLFQLSDPYLQMQQELARAKYSETLVRFNAARAENIIDAQQLEEELNTRQAELDKLQRDSLHLAVTSQAGGVFYLPPDRQDVGQFVGQGDVLAYTLNREQVLLRVLAGQDDIGIIRSREATASIKLANWPGEVFAGTILRFPPAAATTLPSAVLGTQYGGSIPVVPTDELGVTTLQEWFQIEVAVAEGQEMMPSLWAGSRAWVSFDLGYAPLATQLYWATRQLFMNKLAL